MLSRTTYQQIDREWALRAERMQPAASPFHPDYGLPQELRITILRTAEQTNPATAAKTHNVGLSTIYKWRKAMAQDKKVREVIQRHEDLHRIFGAQYAQRITGE